MKRKIRIEKLLKENFPYFNVTIIDNSKMHIGHNSFDGTGETHLLFVLKQKKLSKTKIKIDYKKKINIHNKINEILKDEIVNGLHSYEIKIN